MTPILGFFAFFFILLDLTLDRTDSFILSLIKDALKTRLEKQDAPPTTANVTPIPDLRVLRYNDEPAGLS
jgi:hypothetical protein